MARGGEAGFARLATLLMSFLMSSNLLEHSEANAAITVVNPCSLSCVSFVFLSASLILTSVSSSLASMD